MPVGQWKTLTIREDLKERLQKSFENNPKKIKNQSFSSWLDNLLSDIVDYDETVQRYGNFLEVEGLTDNHVLIMDNWKGNHFFVQISAGGKGALFCQEDGSMSCLHVGFSLALPQVYKALINKGFVPPGRFYMKEEGEKEEKEGTTFQMHDFRREVLDTLVKSQRKPKTTTTTIKKGQRPKHQEKEEKKEARSNA